MATNYPRPIPELTQHQINKFWSKVKILGEDECWDWTGPLGQGGYGLTNINKECWRAPRIAYSLKYGQVPKGLLVLHTCDRRTCVNPKHLYASTHEKNMEDMKTRGRAATGDRNASRLYPEKRKRGADHPMLKDSEWKKRFVYAPKVRQKGIDHYRAVLTEEKVLLARKMHAEGMGVAEIGRTIGCSKELAWAAVHRKTWKHI